MENNEYLDVIDSKAYPPKIRTMQAIHGERTFVLCIPKDFISELKIAKGDYVKCWVVSNRLIVEKASI